jgi:hypothetical protein
MTIAPRPAITASNAARQQGEETLANDTTAVDFDAGNYNNKVVTVTGNITFTLSTVVSGEKTLRIKSDGLGTWTLTWPVNMQGSPPASVSTTTGILVNLYYDGTDYWVL